MRRIFIISVFVLSFSTSSAQEIIYDSISNDSGFRMIATSEEVCPSPDDNFWAMFYLVWGGGEELSDYHFNLHYFSTTPCSIKQGDCLYLILSDGTKISLSSDYDVSSDKSEDPFRTDIDFPYEIICSFTITKLQLRTIVNLGLKAISLELSPKAVSASGEFSNFSKNLSTMLQLIDDRKK